jgi:rubrerythrin
VKIQISTLTLQCRKSREVIDFSPQISYFHGQISAGKSSIMRLIDYCLGGDYERTPALSQELVSVQLLALIGDYQVLFERSATGSNQVQVTWQNEEGKTGSVLAPKAAAPESIWEDDVHNLSDLIFYLAGYTPIKVRKSKYDEDSQLVRLSFRDIMWYCYLDQDHLDSSFYRLEDPFRKLKSRDAMRFITGYYTERMNELEIQLDEVRNGRWAKLEAAKQIRTFLQDYGFGLELEVFQEKQAIDNELREAQQELAAFRKQHALDTHFADELRRRLRELSDTLAREEEALEDLDERIAEQESLRAELLSAKFKLARAESASSVLSGVDFKYCPACGAELEGFSPHETGICPLCGKPPAVHQDNLVPQADIVRRDLTARVDDLAESIERHRRARIKQERLAAQIEREKADLDTQLGLELASYDSAYLARAREVERRIATLQERKRSLERVAQMLEAVNDLEVQADRLAEKERELRREIEAEKNKLTEAENRVHDIERTYLDSLLQVGVPGVQPGDMVQIDLRTWMPHIIPEDGDAYDFYNAGSGGKKTLLNVCYALSVHKVAAEHSLPLPTVLMIDTPMKNIGEDVNESIFRAFYRYLYDLASGPLSATQFIIIDKEYTEPGAGREIQIYERYMGPNNNPLISYYRGP